jgi:hypothetical protein
MGVSVRRKNLLSPSSTKNTATPFTFDASAKDGTIIINGTGDNTSYSIMTLKSGASFNNMLVDGETYTIAMDVSVKKIINIIVRATKLSNNSDVYYQAYKVNNYCISFKVDKSTYKYQELYLQINPTSEIYENVVVKPIIALGSYTSLPFVPYIKDISTVKLFKSGEGVEPIMYDVQADGTVEGVKSLYPNTTLYTDTNGAVIDCTYYQDGRKVKEYLTDMILELGGVINE